MGISLIHNFDKETKCANSIYGAIFNINHTGQEHSGIITSDGERLYRVAQEGLVRGLILPRDMKGYHGVGNVSKLNDDQPLIFYPSKLPNFAMTYDGFIINRKKLKKGMDALLTPFDPELAGRIISRGKDIPDGIEKLAKEVKGNYSLGIITEEGKSYIARCPLGITPLMIGEGKNSYGAITESRAFRKVEMKPMRDVKAGEIIMVDEYGPHLVKTIKGKGMKVCSFQWGYYAWVDSVIEGIPVVVVREEVGKIQAEKDKDLELDMGTAIEDSGKAYGEGFSEHFGIPYKSSLIKFPYWVRSYDRPEDKRGDEASGKISSVDERIKGKVILVFDDSLRRGTVTREGPIKYAKEAGAKEIHLRFGTPRNTCYCRFAPRSDPDNTLPANRFPRDKELAEFLGADSVGFPTVDEFVEAITKNGKLKREELCLGCYTGDFRFI